MKAILLAAGYGTRLYPLTRDGPKALLPVGGRPILDYLVDVLEKAPEIARIVLVTNARFEDAFLRWAQERRLSTPLTVVCDGSTSNENRLGAVADIQFGLQHSKAEEEEAVYVLGSDNLPRFDLLDAVRLHERCGASVVFACREESAERLRSAGVAEVDSAGRVVGFEEKSACPRSDLRVPAFYLYAADAIALLDGYLEGGNNPDAPGYFLGWVVERKPVYACMAPQGTYDVGTLESYRKACDEFRPAR